MMNPLMSLADPNVYSIPMLLLVGWRGEPGKKDDPQHMVKGQATTSILGMYSLGFLKGRSVTEVLQNMKSQKILFPILFSASCGIPFDILPNYQEGAEQVMAEGTELL